jgi:hypothetical protein
MAQFTIFRYYQMLFALFLFLCIYCFIFADSFANDKCYKTTEDTSTNTTSTNTTSTASNSTDTSTTNTTDTNTTAARTSTRAPRHSSLFDDDIGRSLQTTTDTNTTSSSLDEATSLVVMPSLMAYFYIVLVCLVFLESMIIWYFSNLEIAKFGDLNFCQRQMGKIYKCFPYLIILAHWLVFVFIVAQIFLVFVVKDCKDAIHEDTQEGTTTTGLMSDQAEYHVMVTLVLWCFIHCVGGRIRRASYYDAFFYQPEEGGASKLYNFFCIKFGP